MRQAMSRLVLGIVACCLSFSPASAYHAHQKVHVFGYVCDTKEQAESLPKAHRDGGYEAAIAQYRKLRGTYNDIGEPVCAFSNRQFLAELVSEIAAYPDLEIPGEDGTIVKKTFHVIKVQSVANGTIAYVVMDEGITPQEWIACVFPGAALCAD